MAQKVNPAKSEALIHASRTIPRLAEVILDDVVNFFERDSTVGPDEALKDISVETEKALKTAHRLLDKLQVNSAAMRENLGKTKGFIMAQRVAFALAPKIGKDEPTSFCMALFATPWRRRRISAPRLQRSEGFQALVLR
ncbi:MAG: hypothetical protein WDN31_16710 [Hyphomicrobium sp.]